MSESNIIFYTTPNGQVSIQVQYEDGSFWLTQKRMGELFGIESHTITYHLKEIYQSGELQIDSTTRKIRVVQKEGNGSVPFGRFTSFMKNGTIFLTIFAPKTD